MVMSTSTSFAQRVALSFLFAGVGNIVGRLGNVVAVFLVLRLLSPEAFGLASLVLAIFVVLQAVTEMGLGVALVQAREVTRSSLDTLFWLSAALSAGLWAAVTLGAPVVAAFYEEPELTSLLRAVAVGIPLFSLYLVPRSLLTRDLSFGRIAVADNIGLALSASTMIVGAWLGWGAWAIVLGELANRVGQCVMCLVFRPFCPRLRFRWGEIRAMAAFGAWATGSRLVATLYKNMDYLIVGKAFGAEAVGLYALAYRVVHDPIRTVSHIVSQVAYPTFARLQDDLVRLRLYLFAIARISTMVTGTLLVTIAVYIDAVLVSIGFEHWLPSVPLIRVLVIASVLQAVAPILSRLIDALGHARFNFMHSVGALVLMGTAFVVGTRFGLEGVAWAWVAAFPIAFGTKALFCARGTEVAALRFLGRFLAAVPWLLPIAAVAVGLRQGLEAASWSSAPVVTVLGMLGTVLCGLGLTLWRERAMLRALWQERRRRAAARPEPSPETVLPPTAVPERAADGTSKSDDSERT